MEIKDPSNTVFSLAFDFINCTSRSVFLTGKAGTGKTTFLKYIKEKSGKNLAVVAPTGVAAINAGGVTMHSLFQLPLGIFLPGYSAYAGNVQITNRNTLFKNLRLSTSKRQVLQALELLIIDEVSMVRADMLDATDAILRMVRRSTLPFGGVQVLFIGDLYQLPPVAKEEEWQMLSQHYKSPFFFHAKVVQQHPPLCIELNKIYRQNEQDFIDLLNHIRNNEVADDDLQKLHERYQPDMNIAKGYVTLTTHNAKADAINQSELEKLPGKLHTFNAIIENDFPENSFPTDKALLLKEGASVMFIRNDVSEEKKYFNGKLATVKMITHDNIIVQFEDNSEHLLKLETWRNIRYTYKPEEDNIDEEELGSFQQYPIRLAWAITIHKSQGLTFQRAIVDAGSSFAAGQVYVALSRCTSLKGLVLKSRITRYQIKTDPEVAEYSRQLHDEMALQNLLQQEKQKFEQTRFLEVFNFNKVQDALDAWADSLEERQIPMKHKALALSSELKKKMDELKAVADKTIIKMNEWFVQAEAAANYDYAMQRSKAAVSYFNSFLHDQLYLKLKNHADELNGKNKIKKYRSLVKDVAMEVSAHAKKLRAAEFQGHKLFEEETPTFTEPIVINNKGSKKPKGSSALESLMLFNRGFDPDKIAKTRNLAVSTIEGHLADCVKEGKLDITKMVDAEKLETILNAIKESNPTGSAAIREKLGNEYSYGLIRGVIHYWERLNQDATTAEKR